MLWTEVEGCALQKESTYYNMLEDHEEVGS